MLAVGLLAISVVSVGSHSCPLGLWWKALPMPHGRDLSSTSFKLLLQ